MTKIAFLNLLYPSALQVQKEFNLPAIAIVAQSALETGYGAHAPGNMFFGIKAGSSWKGKKQLLWTKEEINGKLVSVQAWFRAYDSPLDSLRDYANLIVSNPRYKNALNKADDPVGYISALKAGGYATDSQYVSKITTIINSLKKKLQK